jgi:hypothetical protein
MSPYVRTAKTSSGATVQIVSSFRRGSRETEHLGSAHDDAELELLKAAARQRLAARAVMICWTHALPRAGRPGCLACPAVVDRGCLRQLPAAQVPEGQGR